MSVKSTQTTDEDKKLIQEAYAGLSRQQWSIEQTENGSYKIKAKSSEGLSEDLAMVAGWHLGDEWSAIDTQGANVEQRLYIDNDSYKDEWYLDTQQIFHATVNSYFDNGFSDCFGQTAEESVSQINEYMGVASVFLRKTYGLHLEYNSASYYNSPLDQCKTITGKSYDDPCGCDVEHHTRDSVKTSFKAAFPGGETVTTIYWTGHRVSDATGNSQDNVSFSSDHSIMMIEQTQSDMLAVLIHELCHQYAGRDHYHRVINGTCVNSEVCSDCNQYNDPRPTSCIMYTTSDFDVWSSTAICTECKGEMLTHLQNHHE